MNEIADFANHLECPSLDGIIFPDGKIQILDIEVQWTPTTSFKVKLGAKSSIGQLQNKGKLNWTSCAIINSLQDQKNEIEILAGEAGYGSDGFVAVINLYSRKLLWLAFFNDSNPFDGLEINNEDIYAMSTINCLWKFNLSQPHLCTVKCL